MSLPDSIARVARVTTMFEEAVVGVRYLRPGERYTVGESPEADLPLACFGAARDLLRVDPRGGIEVVDADGVRVELLDAGGPLTWTRELPGEGRVAAVPARAEARLTIGELSIFVVEDEAPRGQPMPPQITLRDHASTVLVAILCALVFAGLNAIPPQAMSLSIDPFALSQRAARIQLVPPTPPWREVGSGGEHGAIPTQTTRVHVRQGQGSASRARSARVPRLDAEKARGLAADAAAKAGIVGLLGDQQGAHVASIFGAGSVLGTAQAEVFGGLRADATCDGCTGYGAGIVPGHGGGGVGEGGVAVGSLATVGRGGNGGSGGSGYASGVGGLRGRRAGGGPDVQPGPSEVRGVMDKELIRRAIRSHLNEIRFCYERALVGKEDLAGRIVPQFTIGPDGRVVAAVVQSSTLGHRGVEACVLDAVRRVPFPRMPVGSGLTIVSYPFAFQSAGH